jgi:O-acetyl-ADP-ribose deacetylase (regulator of RNase III)
VHVRFYIQDGQGDYFDTTSEAAWVEDMENATPFGTREDAQKRMDEWGEDTSDCTIVEGGEGQFSPTPNTMPPPDSKMFTSLQLPSGEIQVRMGDLTKEPVDAIVNPANEWLRHGGGAARAISNAAGPELQIVSNNHVAVYGPVVTGTAMRTMSYKLPCRWVVHTVGPVAQKIDPGETGPNGEPLRVLEEDCDLLYSAAMAALLAADGAGCTTVSLPAISSGIFGFPKDLCATLLFEAAITFLGVEAENVRVVRFTNFDKPTVEFFIAECERRADAQRKRDQEA